MSSAARLHANHIKVVYTSDSAKHKRGYNASDVREEFAVAFCVPPPHFITFIQKSQFDVECGGLQAIEPAVVTDDIMLVFSDPSVFSQSPQRLGKVRIVGDDGSPITAGSQVLSRVETKAGDIPHRSS